MGGSPQATNAMTMDAGLNAILPDTIDLLGTIAPRADLPPVTAAGIIAALEHPVWDDPGKTDSLAAGIKPGESVVVVVADQTRKTAADLIMPHLLDHLVAAGCALQDISVLIATGIHRSPGTAEIETILGVGTAQRLAGRIHVHDADDDSNLVTVGRIASGQQVRLNRRAAAARRLILTGAACYHYHAGFGGGRKSLVPGLADRSTIAYTHSLALDPQADRQHRRAAPGILEGNPVAEALMACASLHLPTAIINTVLDHAGNLAAVVCGGMQRAHLEACRIVATVERCDIPRRADIVIACADRAGTWIQAHKALYNAARATLPNGRIILRAPCNEGLGNERFRRWLLCDSIGRLCRELRAQPEINGQTALSTRLNAPRTTLVTSMAPDDVAALGMDTAPDMSAAIERTASIMAQRKASRPSAWLMPNAMRVVPFAGDQRKLSGSRGEGLSA